MIKKRIVKDIITISILIAIEQLIKIVISTFFIDERIMLFDGILGFKPHLNTTQLSIFNNELGMHVGIEILIILNIILLPIIPLSIYFVFKNEKVSDGVYLIQNFLMAASICSLADKVFWGGSLDYIYLLNRWIVDLKDIYLVFAMIEFIYCVVDSEIRKRK